MLHRRTSLLVVSLVVASCAPIDVGVERSAIISGTPETGQPAVVAIQIDIGGGMGAGCSGSLIGRYAVMTAKHCVFNETTGAMFAPSQFTVIQASRLVAGSVTAISNVLEIRTTPGVDVATDIMNGDDIAILLLQTGFAPTPLATSTGAPAVGNSVTIVGFGRTMAGTPVPMDFGIKYTGTATVSRVGSHLIETDGPSATCQGDSGGPLFDTSGAVAGITSFGVDMSCVDPHSYYTRVSRHTALIAAALTWTPPCMPTAEICNGLDDDCDGVIDNGVGCFGIGDPCTADSQCSGGSCASIDGHMQCTQPCDPTTAIPHCPFGIYCRATGCGVGECVPGAGGAGNDGDSCAADLDCAATHCGSAGGVARCGRACNTAPSGEICPPGDVCDTTDGTGGCGTCVPYLDSTAPRPLGVPCDSNAMCASHMCVDPMTSTSYCTQVCSMTAPCGSGFHCRDGACVNGDLGGPNSPCLSAMDCGMSAPSCVNVEGDTVCAGPCDAAGSCRDSLTCAAAADGHMYCLRPGDALGATCTDGTTCRSGMCYGTCFRFCSSTSPCPTGFHCADASPMDICLPGAPPTPSHGGCNVSAGTGSGLSLLLLLSLLGLARRGRKLARG